ncbi:MAG: hypothetical protein K6B41_01945 [Butyrivibrio sp.]|nr:hypothetical protein [Butyrivibrio sp.]
MQDKIQITKIRPYPLGNNILGNAFNICTIFGGGEKCGINFYNTRTHKNKLVMIPDECRFGNVCSCKIVGVLEEYNAYNLYEDGRYFCDPYADNVIGLEKWAADVSEEALYNAIRPQNNNVDTGVRPHIPYEDMLIYLLNIRSFTKNNSSEVPSRFRGTYKGVIYKIPYIKSLGFNAVEIMPVYEMNVVHKIKINGSTDNKNNNFVFNDNGNLRDSSTLKPKINLWGFEDGYYFSPRKAFSSDPENAEEEISEMIKAFHDNHMEVILQFYFDDKVNRNILIESLRYWAYHYNIDGIHLKGDNVPLDMITSDPYLKDIKIFYYGFDYGRLYGRQLPKRRVLASYNDDYMFVCRRFLKGDDNTVSDFLNCMIGNSNEHGIINYVCNYDGFRLSDLVSYEHKRNEDNDENNQDGTDNNLSWNCGFEGKTRKKSILDIRLKQMKNALTMLFMAEGTPLLYSGDEFGDSQDGNNNPYCQDNKIGHVDWKNLEKNKDFFEFVRFLIRFRKKYGVLHKPNPFKLMDYNATGYPDLSYHGTDSWRPDLSNYSHTIGMLYSCEYENKDVNDFIYIIYNMHWTPVMFSLPKLPDGMKWYEIADTANDKVDEKGQLLEKQQEITCVERSIKILVGKGKVITGKKRLNESDKKSAKSTKKNEQKDFLNNTVSKNMTSKAIENGTLDKFLKSRQL